MEQGNGRVMDSCIHDPFRGHDCQSNLRNCGFVGIKLNLNECFAHYYGEAFFICRNSCNHLKWPQYTYLNQNPTIMTHFSRILIASMIVSLAAVPGFSQQSGTPEPEKKEESKTQGLRKMTN